MFIIHDCIIKKDHSFCVLIVVLIQCWASAPTNSMLAPVTFYTETTLPQLLLLLLLLLHIWTAKHPNIQTSPSWLGALLDKVISVMFVYTVHYRHLKAHWVQANYNHLYFAYKYTPHKYTRLVLLPMVMVMAMITMKIYLFSLLARKRWLQHDSIYGSHESWAMSFSWIFGSGHGKHTHNNTYKCSRQYKLMRMMYDNPT